MNPIEHKNFIKSCEESPDRKLNEDEVRCYIRHLLGIKPKERTLLEILKAIFK